MKSPHHDNLRELIAKMQHSGLQNLDEKYLTDRVDIKYLLPVTVLPEILDKISDNYSVLEINGNRLVPYTNIYFDTPEYHFFLQHVKDKPERYKVRYRSYPESRLTFLEIKKKTRKNRTQKLRLEAADWDGQKFRDNEKEFIRMHIPEKYLNLGPAISSSFKRVTLVGKDQEEKVTLDYDLTVSDLNGNTASLPYLCILEIKKASLKEESPLSKQLKQKGIRSAGFSKFCIGSMMVRTMPHVNILKNKLLSLKKIEDEYNRTSGCR
jgi:hypothetical protein